LAAKLPDGILQGNSETSCGNLESVRPLQGGIEHTEERVMQRAVTAMVMAAGLLMWTTVAFAGEMSLGAAEVLPGQPVTLALTYTGGGRVAAAVATDIRFNAKVFTNPRCESGSALASNGTAAKSVKCAEPKPGLLRVAVFGLNVAPVPNGEVALVTFDVAPGARPGQYRLRQKPTAADATGNDFRLQRHHGAVRVKRPATP
jgi:hypothetical protein